jgi:hypothetical protein
MNVYELSYNISADNVEALPGGKPSQSRQGECEVQLAKAHGKV